MNPRRQFALLLLQALLLAVLIGLEFTAEEPALLRGVLLAALCAATAYQFRLRSQSRAALRQTAAELRRSADGHGRTRLLAKDDLDWNEVIYAVNNVLEKWERVQIDAIRSQTARRRLLSSISHDIRTPLTSIIGYVDALRDDVALTDEERQEYLAILSKKSNALKEMIDQIFTMAKLDADEMPHRPETFDLAELARETLIAFLPELKQQNLQLEVRLPDEPCPLYADRLSIARILNNLVKNAVQYGSEGGVLGIELAETPDEVRLLVRDRGPGLSAAELPRVFDRMYRSDPARNPNTGGSGLGLAIAKALVEKNGGRLLAESLPWERTTFGIAFKKPLRNR